MRIRVFHETKLAFSQPVRSLHLALRLTPRSFESQYVLRWRVGVDLDATARLSEDAFGSVVHGLSWHRPVEGVTITAAGEVQTSDAVGVVRGAVEVMPALMFLRASPLAQANPSLREFAESVAAADPLERLHRLMAAVRGALTLAPGFGGEAPASEAFALGKGGAADFAHVFIACARALEIPARFITGYRLGPAAEGAQMHAWAEALAPGLGWVGFDAVNDLCPNDEYIRVAAGLDAKDAAPVRLWTNVGETEITASLAVEQAEAQGQN
ncbi:MAG: transglutaminase family protein [Pseudomonadota bacterium]|nr:transglutaminase family protein [Pseudomonadota bacterium]